MGCKSRVTIKEVGSEKIQLEEVSVNGDTDWYVVLGLFALFMTLSSGVMLMLNMVNTTNPQSPISLIIVGAGFSLFLLLFLGSNGGLCKQAEGYRISIHGQSEPSDCVKYIRKVNPEVDQVAVCKAATELETVAKSIVKKRRELETIAFKCK